MSSLRCDICGEDSPENPDDPKMPGPFGCERVTVQTLALKGPAWLEGRENLHVEVWICWACWNSAQEEWDRSALIALAVLGNRLLWGGSQNMTKLALKKLAQWL